MLALRQPNNLPDPLYEAAGQRTVELTRRFLV
jgi:hypothetical protein